MNKTYLLTAIAIFAIATAATTAYAQEDPASQGLERADREVHAHAPQNDITFHEGTCQGGHSTSALGPQGCDNPLISEPGASEEHP